jgi:hypothetical protein
LDDSTHGPQSGAPAKARSAECWDLETAGADGEEGGMDGLFGEGEEVEGVEGRAVIGETAGVRVGAGGDVGGAREAGAGPPAAAGVVDGGEVGGAAACIDHISEQREKET